MRLFFWREEAEPGRVWLGLEEEETCRVWVGLRWVAATLSDEMVAPVDISTNSLSLDSKGTEREALENP